MPEGLGAEVFSVRALRDAAEQATAAYDREHVTPWLRRTLGELLFVPVGCPDDVSAYRATVDVLGDYVRVSSLFDDEQDPVGRPWATLMTRLADRVDRAGTRVTAARTDAGHMSQVVLSARNFDAATRDERPAERAERLRSLIAEAIERGVTHIEVGRGDGRSEELLKACAEPALVKRFGIISRVAPRALGGSGSPVADELAVEAAVERTFANLGRRGVDVLVFPGAVSAERGWATGRAYRDEGLVSALGLVAEGAADLAWALGTPDVAYVEVRGDHLDRATLSGPSRSRLCPRRRGRRQGTAGLGHDRPGHRRGSDHPGPGHPCRPDHALVLTLARGPRPPGRSAGQPGVGVVEVEDLVHRPVGLEPAAPEVETPGAEPAEVGLGVGHQEERPALGEQRLHALVALLAEVLVADREHLVDEHDGFVERRDEGEAESHLHARGEVSERHVQALPDLRPREVDDRVEALGDGLLVQTVQARRQHDVLARRRARRGSPR